MRSIRNFFHNINDILLAIIIVAVAAGIIYWRMNIILDYPQKLVESQTEYTQEDASDDAETEAVDDAAEDENADDAEPQG